MYNEGWEAGIGLRASEQGLINEKFRPCADTL